MIYPGFEIIEGRMYNAVRSQASLTGDPFKRLPGVDQVVVLGHMDAFAGGGAVRMILEGSNDLVNWHMIKQGGANQFTMADEQKILNPNERLTDIYRYTWLKVRLEITAGAPVFSAHISVCGRQSSGDVISVRETMVRSSSDVEGTVHTVPQGVTFLTAQIVASNVVLGGATSFDVLVECSPDYTPTAAPSDVHWQEINRTSVVANGSSVALDGGLPMVDLTTFSWYRFRVVDVGGVGTSYTLNLYVGQDSEDWRQGATDPSDQLAQELLTVICQVTFDAPSAEVGNAISVVANLIDSQGNALAEKYTFEFLIGDTDEAGDLDLATNATFSAVGGGATAKSVVGSNRILVELSAAGTATLTVSDLAVETVYLTASTPKAPLPKKQLLWKVGQADLTFA